MTFEQILDSLRLAEAGAVYTDNIAVYVKIKGYWVRQSPHLTGRRITNMSLATRAGAKDNWSIS